MQSKAKFLESSNTDREFTSLQACAKNSSDIMNNLFIAEYTEKYWKRGAELQRKFTEAGSPEAGFTKGYAPTGDTAVDSVAITREIFSVCLHGFDLDMDDSFVKKISTESDTFYYPLSEYAEIVDEISSTYGSGEQAPHSEKSFGYAFFNLTSEKGSKKTWTRAAVESASFDLMGELVESAGHDIAVQLMTEILAEVITSNTGDASTNASVAYADWMPIYSTTNGTVGLTFTKHSSTAGISFAQFLAVIAAVDVGYIKTTLVMTANSGDVLPVSSPTAGVNDIGAKVYDGTTSKYIGVLVGYQPNSAISAGSTVMTWVILARQGATIATGHPLSLVRIDGTAGIGAAGAGAASATAHGLRKYGTPDTVLVSPDVFWDLMGILQFTMSLFGDANVDAIQSGVIRTKFGCRIIKQSLLPLNTVVALNSAKALGLCFRRNIKVEMINFPSWNEYGIQATIRAKAKVLYPMAMQVSVGA